MSTCRLNSGSQRGVVSRALIEDVRRLEGGQESIALLRLDQVGIRVAQYLTELPPKKVLERRLHESITLSRALMENRKEVKTRKTR